jgi:hypothetical protein
MGVSEKLVRSVAGQIRPTPNDGRGVVENYNVDMKVMLAMLWRSYLKFQEERAAQANSAAFGPALDDGWSWYEQLLTHALESNSIAVKLLPGVNS